MDMIHDHVLLEELEQLRVELRKSRWTDHGGQWECPTCQILHSESEAFRWVKNNLVTPKPSS